MVLRFLLEKEFKQFVRHPFLRWLVPMFPIVIMAVMPWAATLDIRNIDTVVVDADFSPASRRFSESVNASSYFRLHNITSDYDTALTSLEYGDVDLIIQIPAGFGNDLVTTGSSSLQIALNTVNSTRGVLGQAYLQSLVADFGGEYRQDGPASGAQVEVIVSNKYNPLLDYKLTMVPGLMVIILVLLCGFLPAANITQEKEWGTIEQINVTPVSKVSFILAKMIPYWIIGLVALTFAFLLAWLIFGLTPAGSLGTIYLFAGLFILTMAGMGLLVSNISSNMQQATFVILFFVMIFIMMCGLLTPVSSMPDWAQAIAAVNPMKYMVDVMKFVYLKGSTVADLWRELVALSVMAVILNVWAILSYRKTN